MKRCHPGIVLALALSGVFGCAHDLADPLFENPFDPGGPDGGDPFQILAIPSGNSVVVTWRQPDHPGVTEYAVLHSDDDNAFASVGTVNHLPAADENTFIHNEPVPNAVNYYKVMARDGEGNATAVSAVASAPVDMPPFFQIGDGSPSVASRFVTLAIKTIVGDSLDIAANDTFTGATTLATVPGDTTFAVDWNLGPAAGNSETKDLYLRCRTAADTSQVNHQSVLVSFLPSLSVVGNPATVADEYVDLAVSDTTGLVQMRFASHSDSLESTAWVPADSTYPDYRLADVMTEQTIYGEFESNFGFSAIATCEIAPDDLSGVSFYLQSLAGSQELTDSVEVVISSQAVALQMRFSENPSFVGVPWLTYAALDTFTLSEDEGEKVVYGQYRNFWTESPVLADWITYVAQPLEIGFHVPLDSTVVLGGSQLTVSGFARAATGGDPIDLVEVDLGQGFVPATGTESWSVDWDVPVYTEDTELTLRARVTAGAETATGLLTVTVTQFIVQITEPADGAEIPDETVTTVAGLAASILGGAPLDSVKVNLAGADTLATGLESWSVDWDVPAVEEQQQALVIAEAWAGGESVADTVTVTINP